MEENKEEQDKNEEEGGLAQEDDVYCQHHTSLSYSYKGTDVHPPSTEKGEDAGLHGQQQSNLHGDGSCD